VKVERIEEEKLGFKENVVTETGRRRSGAFNTMLCYVMFRINVLFVKFPL